MFSASRFNVALSRLIFARYGSIRKHNISLNVRGKKLFISFEKAGISLHKDSNGTAYVFTCRAFVKEFNLNGRFIQVSYDKSQDYYVGSLKLKN
jgi:hypothetical protein